MATADLAGEIVDRAEVDGVEDQPEHKEGDSGINGQPRTASIQAASLRTAILEELAPPVIA